MIPRPWRISCGCYYLAGWRASNWAGTLTDGHIIIEIYYNHSPARSEGFIYNQIQPNAPMKRRSDSCVAVPALWYRLPGPRSGSALAYRGSYRPMLLSVQQTRASSAHSITQCWRFRIGEPPLRSWQSQSACVNSGLISIQSNCFGPLSLYF